LIFWHDGLLTLLRQPIWVLLSQIPGEHQILSISGHVGFYVTSHLINPLIQTNISLINQMDICYDAAMVLGGS
jgi:hypothetical protein